MPHLLLDILKKTAGELQRRDCRYAVAGGLAATFFRNTPRITNDVDIAIYSGSLKATRALAEEVIKALGWKVHVGHIANAKGAMKTSVALISGTPPETKSVTNSVDFLLPSFPWLEESVARAQENRLDYGFGFLPTLCVEDVIVAKAFALSVETTRFQDMDDIKAIFETRQALDMAYILKRFESLEISLPKALRPFAPKALARSSIRKAGR